MQKLDLIVLTAIEYLFGDLKVRYNKKGFYYISVMAARDIVHIINYFTNTMKGMMKAFEFRIWSQSYKKYKSNSVILQA